MIKFNEFFTKELIFNNLRESEFSALDVIQIIDIWEQRLIGDLCICKRSEKKVLEKLSNSFKKDLYSSSDIVSFIETAEETNGLIVFIKVDHILNQMVNNLPQTVKDKDTSVDKKAETQEEKAGTERNNKSKEEEQIKEEENLENESYENVHSEIDISPNSFSNSFYPSVFFSGFD